MEDLPLKPFKEMTAADYAAIGLACGLEVHQQLLTRSKLFCRCPAGRYSMSYDAEVLRHMRPTLSEMGEYDGTALMEKKTKKNIIYRLNHNSVCTYEFDDTPPFLIDEESIDIALELALLLKLNIVNELHIARKQYLDGSIPTGFQRTTILGIDGRLPFNGRTIRIRQLGLEEDSCREVSDIGHDRVYLTDRLGMPLIEVVTEPDMSTPQETAAVCNLIRKVCRSTQKVRRGYGATRQDVNVSVEGGTRIEIKGVPQIWRIPHLIYNEACRQVALLGIRRELQRRGIGPDSLETESGDVTTLVAKTSFAPIRSAFDSGLRVKCVLLRGFGGMLNKPTQEHTTFAKEFSDRVRVIACLTQLPNIAHSEAATDSPSAQEWQELKKRMKAGPDDTLILVWGDERDTETACGEITIRAHQATIGVPSDTRQSMKDGTNGFERVLPGAARMYPDTDLPPIEITADRVERARRELPAPVWETEARYRAGGMVADDAQRMCISPHAALIDRAIDHLKLSPLFLGVLFGQRMRSFARKELRPGRLSDGALLEILQTHAEERLAREGVFWLIEHLLKRETGESITDDDVHTALLEIRPATERALRRSVDDAVAACESHRFKTDAKRVRYLMGRLMRELIGRVDGRRLRELILEKISAGRRTVPRRSGAGARRVAP